MNSKSASWTAPASTHVVNVNSFVPVLPISNEIILAWQQNLQQLQNVSVPNTNAHKQQNRRKFEYISILKKMSHLVHECISNNGSNKNNMKYNFNGIIVNLCEQIPFDKDFKTLDEECLTRMCKFISLVCIHFTFEFETLTMDIFLSIMIDFIFRDYESCTHIIVDVLRTISHVLFDRIYCVTNEKTQRNLIQLLICLSCPQKRHSLESKSNEMSNKTIDHVSFVENVDKLCVYYLSYLNIMNNVKNEMIFGNNSEMFEYINNTSMESMVMSVLDAWKYYALIRKYALTALGHCMIGKQTKNGWCSSYMNIICECMFLSFHLLTDEYKNYSKNGLCRNAHEFAKEVSPVVKALNSVLKRMESKHFDNNDIMIDIIIEDLKDLMIIGTDTELKNINTEYDIDHYNSYQASNGLIYERNGNRPRMRNRVLLDWDGSEFYREGYTSDLLLSMSASDMFDDHSKSSISYNERHASYFLPFDVFSKLRMYVQQCFALILNGMKAFLSFWNKLLPTNEQSTISQQPFGGPNIFTVLLYDPHPRVRHASASTLYHILQTYLRYQQMAKQQKRKNIGNEFNVNLNNMNMLIFKEKSNQILLSLHKGLIFALSNSRMRPENLVIVRTQIIKCFISLISITDYESIFKLINKNMDIHLLTPLIDIIANEYSMAQNIVIYKNSLYQLLADIYNIRIFNDYVCLDIEPIIAKLLCKRFPISSNFQKRMNHRLQKDDKYKILIAMAKNYRKPLCLWWNRGLRQLVSDGLAVNQSYVIVLDVIKFLTAWLMYVPISPMIDTRDSVHGFFKLKNSSIDLGQWIRQLIVKRFVEIPVHSQQSMVDSAGNKKVTHVHCAANDNAAIKSRLCLLMANMKYWQFNAFNESIRGMLLHFICECLSDDIHPTLRGSACRAYGQISAMFLSPVHKHFYQQGCDFLLKLMSHPKGDEQKAFTKASAVQTKALCAFSNLCHYQNSIPEYTLKQVTQLSNVLLFNKSVDVRPESKPRLPLHDLISDGLLLNMIDQCLFFLHERYWTHNICQHSLRSLGFAARWLKIEEKTNEKTSYISVWIKICDAFSTFLLSDDCSLKVKLVACHSASNIICNRFLHKVHSIRCIRATYNVYVALCQVLDENQNLRMKICAVYALSLPAERNDYGLAYKRVCKYVINAYTNLHELQAPGFAQTNLKILLNTRIEALLMKLFSLFDVAIEFSDLKKMTTWVSILENFATIDNYDRFLSKEVEHTSELQILLGSLAEKQKLTKL